MKIQLLPSSFDGKGRATPEQRLSCYLIDDTLAIDAGSIGLAATPEQQQSIRDILITHPHMDHIASLPIFIDDLFDSLTSPIRVHATEETITLLERDIFNWTTYPRFSELTNRYGHVMEYVPFYPGQEFKVSYFRCIPIPVNHTIPTVGLVITDGKTTLAYGSDTAETEEFWQVVNRRSHLEALLIEASFPNALAQLATNSRHLTPQTLKQELRKLNHSDVDILAVHLKPAYRKLIVQELEELKIPNLKVMEPGQKYVW
jgi:cAMP phosphodiesterase